jgi:HPt (histidine-containing phosphotransfer) domain-containing protein
MHEGRDRSYVWADDDQESPENLSPGEHRASVVVRVDRLIADLIPGYLEARRMEIEQIRDLIRTGDLAGLALIGHRLRGSGEGYGFREITALGGEMEEAAEAGDISAVARAARQLGSYLDAVTFTVEE